MTLAQRFLPLLATLPLLGCATTPSEPPQPLIRTVEVAVAVPTPCPALASMGDEPSYPDTDEAIRSAPSIGALAQLYAQGRLMRVQRLAEYAAAKAGCMF